MVDFRGLKLAKKKERVTKREDMEGEKLKKSSTALGRRKGLIH